MRRYRRGAEPAIFVQHARDWTTRWASGNRRFAWPKEAAEALRVAFLRDHGAWCAYCDGEAPSPQARVQIDHFRPKERFRELAFAWSNLFPCCSWCNNSKGSTFDERLLKPDESAYSFSSAFWFDPESGRLEPSLSATPNMQDRAATTIRVLQLNRSGLRAARRNTFLRLERGGAQELELSPYRFIAEAMGLC